MGASLGTGGSGRGRGRRGGGTNFRPMAEINVTPFVDVMLVLLIVFMVSAPLLTAGVKVDLPSSKAKPMDAQDDKPIEITLTREGKIFIGESEVKRENLIGLLTAMTEGQTDRRIYIRGDQKLDYGAIMGVLGAVNGAGFSKVALISEAK